MIAYPNSENILRKKEEMDPHLSNVISGDLNCMICLFYTCRNMLSIDAFFSQQQKNKAARVSPCIMQNHISPRRA